MKKFLQIARKSEKIIDVFYINDDGYITAPRIKLLYDPDGYYANMKIGEEKQFTGQTYLKRIK